MVKEIYMKLSVKRYNNDVSKAYRILMRKLNKDGYYEEIRRNNFYISKSEQQREEKKSGIQRYKRAEQKRVELLDKLERQASQGKRLK
jgi:ribosomal protein S21